jgi:hypothetical protein
MIETSTDSIPGRREAAGSPPARCEVPGLRGITGRLRLQVADIPSGVLQVEPGGAVQIVNDGSADAVLTVDTAATLTALLQGELSPIVAHLQDRLQVEGDAALALRVLFGLQAGSPWKVETRRRDGSCYLTP